MTSRHLACSLGRGTDFADGVCIILKAGSAKKNAGVCVRCATQSPAKTCHQISGELLNKEFFVFRMPPLLFGAHDTYPISQSLPILRYLDGSRTGIRTRSDRHPVASKLHRSVWRKRDLQDLICESSFFFEIGQNEIKEALLTLEVQASRSIDTDEARVKGNICIDSLATRLLRRPPKVDTVVRNERPIAIENCGLQLPILLPSKTEMIDVRAHESLVSSQLDQARAEIFIDQQLLHA
jgi:hypothetical protein